VPMSTKRRETLRRNSTSTLLPRSSAYAHSPGLETVRSMTSPPMSSPARSDSTTRAHDAKRECSGGYSRRKGRRAWGQTKGL
jgi:hypothetical protein